MVRLIDADKLILHLNDYALQEAPFRGEGADTYNAIKQCIEAVEEQPTAYDVDKVVAQLEELRYKDVCDHLECEDCLYNEECGIGTDQTHNVEVDTAIEIVKAGAKND